MFAEGLRWPRRTAFCATSSAPSWQGCKEFWVKFGMTAASGLQAAAEFGDPDASTFVMRT